MRRYAIIMLAATLALSACSSVVTTNEIESTSVVLETEAVETTESVDLTEPLETEVSKEIEDVIYNTPLNISFSAKYEGEWDEKGPIITADSAELLILDDGYDALKKTIERYNEKTWEDVYRIYTEYLEYTKEDVFSEGTKISISREIDVKRADSKVLSFINAETAFLGGSHGSYYENAEVFDAVTGKALELEDVVTDLDAVYKLVAEDLAENYEKESFFEDYESWLYEMFFEPDSAMTSQVEWVLTMEGIEFRFSPYVLGPWVSGTFEAKIPYSGNESLFYEEYCSSVKNPVQVIEPETEILIDTNGDGQNEQVWFTVEWDEKTYNTTLTVNRSGKTEEGSDMNSSVVKDDIFGWFKKAYLMYSEEEVPYLYVEIGMDNDWEKLEIVRLAETETESDMKYIGGTRNAIYGHFVSDPKQFALYDRVDVLGTYMGFKHYSVGEDGMPVTEDEMYRIANTYFKWEYALISKKDLNVTIHVEGSEEKVEEKLPKGTKFRPYMTDGTSVIVMELEDGRYCDIPVEKKPDEYFFYINDISEYDLFENLPYAG